MSTKISKEQLKYARYRLEQIKDAEWAALDKTFWSTPATDPLTFKEAIEAIKKGKIKPRTKTLGGLPMNHLTVSKSTRVIDLFEIGVAERTFDYKKSEAARKAHDAKWDKIFDKLFLGDVTEVLALIAENDKA